MSTLGFDNYIEPLKLYLQKYREVVSRIKCESFFITWSAFLTHAVDLLSCTGHERGEEPWNCVCIWNLAWRACRRHIPWVSACYSALPPSLKTWSLKRVSKLLKQGAWSLYRHIYINVTVHGIISETCCIRVSRDVWFCKGCELLNSMLCRAEHCPQLITMSWISYISILVVAC